MNIVKLQEDLKNVPFKNLIFYVQNPNGQVPSYLALAEIKRRKDMESRAAAQQNAPSSLSVAEEMTAPRQNIGPQFDTRQSMLAAQQQTQPGVASLPTGDMYQEKNFATGGIVAFDRGGSTDDVSVTSHADVRPLTNEQMQILAAEYLGGADLGNDRLSAGVNYAGGIDKLGITRPELRDIHARYRTDDGAEYRGSYAPDARQLMLDRIKGNTSMGLTYSPDNVGIRAGYSFADGGSVGYAPGGIIYGVSEDEYNKLSPEDQQIVRNEYEKIKTQKRSFLGDLSQTFKTITNPMAGLTRLVRPGAEFGARAMSPYTDSTEAVKSFTPGYIQLMKDPRNAPVPNQPAAPAADAKSAAPAITQDMIDQLNKDNKPAPSGIGGLRPNLPTEQPKSLNDMINERKKLLESQGVDTTYYSKMLADLKKEKEEDLDSSKRMMQANILFSLAKSIGETPGGLMRGLVKAGADVGPVVAAGMKEQREIERLGKKEERAAMALDRAEKRGDADAIEKARDKYEQIKADKEGRIISGEYSLAAARIASRPTTYEQLMRGLKENKDYYKMVDGKPVFDIEKAYGVFQGTKSGNISEALMYQKYQDQIKNRLIDPSVTFEAWKLTNGPEASTAGWGNLTSN